MAKWAALAAVAAAAAASPPERITAARLVYSKGCRLNRLPKVDAFITKHAPEYPLLLLQEKPYAEPTLEWLNQYGRRMAGTEPIDLVDYETESILALVVDKGLEKGKEFVRNLFGVIQWEVEDFPAVGRCQHGFRATLDCERNAPHDAAGDAACDAVIGPEQSGHCVCEAVAPFERRIKFDCDPETEWMEMMGDVGKKYYWNAAKEAGQWDKPSDWLIDDPSDSKPGDWDSEPESIPDPAESRPDGWDDESDGEWVAAEIPNPKYKGEWRPKQIKNPDTEWVLLDVPARSYFHHKETKESTWDRPAKYLTPRQNFTCVDVCGVVHPDAVLVVATGRQSDKTGTYEVLDGVLANSRPVWQRLDGLYVLYSTPEGKWSLAGQDVAEDDYEVSAGFITSKKPHKGVPPSAVDIWQTHDGQTLIDDSDVRVHYHTKLGKDAVLPTASAPPGHDEL